MNLSRDVGGSVIILTITAFLIFSTYDPAYQGLGMDPFGPMLFPRWVLIGIGLLGTVNLLLGWRRRGACQNDVEGSRWPRAVLLAAAISIPGLAMSQIGFFAAAVAGFVATGAVLGYRRWLRLVLLALTFVLGAWALFTFVINLGLPTSPLSAWI